MRKNIIFDLDGTLWDSTEAAAKIWSDVAAKYPEIKDTITAEKLKRLYGLPLEEIAGKLFPSVPEELALRVMQECVQVQCPILSRTGAILMGKVAETFEELKKQYQLFIVSNCKSGYIESFLEAHKLGNRITDFTCPGETGLLKADNIRLICERNHISLTETVYVGDTVSDEIAAHEAGVPFIFAAYGFGASEHFEYELRDIAGLPELMQQINEDAR
ncbi:MAG: HAD family hydrolase [Lachnospiraceae bacterium]|nr:HAD family hydrolase [Lachnospiraceae bacterium]